MYVDLSLSLYLCHRNRPPMNVMLSGASVVFSDVIPYVSSGMSGPKGIASSMYRE